MSKRGSNNTKTPAYQGYVPVYLDDKAKKAIKANLGTMEQVFDKFTKYVEDGYRLTIGWDDYNECMSASLFDLNHKRPTAGYILAAKHQDLLTAVNTLIYLHEKVYPDGWDIERVGDRGDVSW